MDNSQYFDQAPEQKHLDRNQAKADEVGYKISNRWKGDQSKDFYMGMVAAQRVMISCFPNTVESDILDPIIKLGIEAMLLAKQKSI